MERATDRLHWKRFTDRHIAPRNFVFAVAAAFPILALMSRTPASWWWQSGFQTDPGTFVAYANDLYPLCRPWRDRTPDLHHEQGVHVTSRIGTLSGSKQRNLAVLLPRDAHVTGIYCGAASKPNAALTDCSVLHCPLPAHVQVEDGVYTRGRGVEFSFRDRSAKPEQKIPVGVWVLWRQGAV